MLSEMARARHARMVARAGIEVHLSAVKFSLAPNLYTWQSFSMVQQRLTALERLAKWIDDRKTRAAFAAEIGCGEAHLSLILSGDRTPSPPLAYKIEDVTGISARELLLLERRAAATA
jgi:hypothetical protein